MKLRIRAFVSCILLCELAGLFAYLMMGDGLAWYSALVQPPLTPPSYVFGPVWAVLYFLTGVSLYGFYVSRGFKLLGYLLFGLQLVLNVLWGFIFFGEHLIAVALIDLFWIIGLTALTTFIFYKHEKKTGYLLPIYVAWLIYAAYLNFALLVLNP